MPFRSLSPTGESQYGGWAKFPAAFGRKAALKQAAKFVPKESEVSVILTADDTDRIPIPDEIMKAVGARMFADMTGEQPQRHDVTIQRNHGIIRGATAGTRSIARESGPFRRSTDGLTSQGHRNHRLGCPKELVD